MLMKVVSLVAMRQCYRRVSILLSLGRVDPAPHTRHLQGLFAPSTQNSSLRSLSQVDSVAHRQYYCGDSEELAIPETAGSRIVARSFWECSEQLGVL